MLKKTIAHVVTSLTSGPALVGVSLLILSGPAFAAPLPSNDVALGNGATAIGTNDVSIGGGTSASGTNNININGYIEPNADTPPSLDTSGGVAASSASGTSGTGAVQNDSGATALGDGATVYTDNEGNSSGTAIGSDSTASGDSTALGTTSTAGPSSEYAGNYSSGNIAIGGAVRSGSNNISEGNRATASGDGSIAIGAFSTAGIPEFAEDPSTAVGQDSSATGNDSEAYGYESGATGSDSAALGTGAAVSDNNSVALGAGSTANTAPVGTSVVTIRGQSYNFAGANPSGVVSVGSSGSGSERRIGLNGPLQSDIKETQIGPSLSTGISAPETRLITNVAAGQISSTSTDAINGSELYATNQALDNLQATQGSTGVLHYTNASGATSDVPTATASAGNASTGPVTISSVGDGTIADGSTTAANGNDVWQAEQAANTHTNQVFTLTCHQAGNGSGDIVCGRNAQVSGKNASAQGTDAQAHGNGANAYGAQTQALGDDATAIGNAAIANGYSTTAVGDHAEALGPNSTAVGEDSVANGSDSVALGNGSVANRPNSVSVGNAATGLDRQITNVAAGTQPHDAVNLQQFDAGLQGAKGYAQSEADKVGSIDASLAAAGAEAAAGQQRNTVAGGTSDYNGQSSFAFAYQHRFGTHWAAMMTVGSNGSASNTVVAGAASYSWK